MPAPATDVVYQGTSFKLYTPSNNTVDRAYTVFYLTQDANVDVTDHEGHNEDTVPFAKGYHPLLVSKIRAVSTGLVYLIGSNKLL